MFLSMDAPVFEIDGAYYLLIIKEALVGLLIGFIAYVIMSCHSNCRGIYRFSNGVWYGECHGSANRCTESNYGTISYILLVSFFF